MTELSGSCLCGAVRFSVSGEVRQVVSCHCTQCRKQSGHFWATSAARKADMEIVGTEYVRWYQATAEARRGFCELCGSLLFFEGKGREDVAFSAGALDGETGLKTEAHVFVAEKGDYYQIAAGEPQFDGRD
ncbi:GFA family protein [Afifella sp. H1R]|uniref:GFA family protein n=1 Tax=unclassified Afifella TaxID=2624128 RepID=UPI001F1C5A77|nr:GFA family protein [Afifella sp. H1R]MCF1505844.1 GFA family protein [Afifella sp. H1R]